MKTPKERREALLDEFEASGLSGRKFAVDRNQLPDLCHVGAEDTDTDPLPRKVQRTRLGHLYEIGSSLRWCV